MSEELLLRDSQRADEWLDEQQIADEEIGAERPDRVRRGLVGDDLDNPPDGIEDYNRRYAALDKWGEVMRSLDIPLVAPCTWDGTLEELPVRVLWRAGVVTIEDLEVSQMLRWLTEKMGGRIEVGRPAVAYLPRNWTPKMPRDNTPEILRRLRVRR